LLTDEKLNEFAHGKESLTNLQRNSPQLMHVCSAQAYVDEGDEDF